MSQASWKKKAINTIACWPIWIGLAHYISFSKLVPKIFNIYSYNAMPFVYADEKFARITPTTVATVSALSVLSPIIFWTVDALTSPSDSAKRNLKIIRQNGYSLPHIALYNAVGGAIFHFTFWFVGQTISGYKLPENRWDWLKISATFAFNACAAEVLFTWAHKRMHEVPIMAKIHQMHHCTRWPGLLQTTNFNPLDLLMEVGAPAVVVLSTFYATVSKDKMAKLSLGLSLCGLSLWYCTDHDETRGSHHSRHHLACNGQYTIYLNNVDFGTKNELIRGLLKESAQKEKALKVEI